MVSALATARSKRNSDTDNPRSPAASVIRSSSLDDSRSSLRWSFVGMAPPVRTSVRDLTPSIKPSRYAEALYRKGYAAKTTRCIAFSTKGPLMIQGEKARNRAPANAQLDALLPRTPSGQLSTAEEAETGHGNATRSKCIGVAR